MNYMTLTEMSYYSRRMAPFAIVAVLLVLIIFYAFRIFFLYLDTQKIAQVNANPIFGQIKRPQVEVTATPSGKLNYVLDTIEGRPVTATDSAQVFFLPKVTTKFGYNQKITLMAQTFGFSEEGLKYKLVDQDAQFADQLNMLHIDIASFNFTYQYALDQDPSIFDNVRIPDTKEAEDKATEFLRNLDAYPEDLAQGKVNIVYMNYDPTTTQLKVVENPDAANMVEADFYRPDVGDYPILSPKYFNSQNYVAMVFNQNSYKVVKAQVKHFDASKEQVGLYPLVTGDQAYQRLQSGQALFISLPQNTSTITIKKMFLGYLDPDIYQQYLQPVYVFLGDNNFVAYVPAIVDAYTAK